MFVVFATMFLGKKIIIRPNFDCSRLFKLFFLFQLFIVLYFVVCIISCYHFVVK